MAHRDKRVWMLATGLAGLAGYTDAVGYLLFNGLYVSFMSGNSTQMAVGVVMHPTVAMGAASLLSAFVLGVFGATLLGSAAGARRRPIVLTMVTALLVAAASSVERMPSGWAACLMAAAMGAANIVIQRDGETSVGVTYMTGTLVRFGQGLAGALVGGPRWAWSSDLLLWAGLVCGAVIGAQCYARLGSASIWIAALAAGCSVLLAAILGPGHTADHT
jgi:uncharacterized membrane protein YoaK (UPF0700 family)